MPSREDRPVPGQRPGSAAAEPPFKPVRTRKAFESVVGQIVELIRSGQLQEGDGFPGERRLAELFEVSRPTVRLAVSELADAGLLEVRPGRAGGIRVASMWIPDGVVESAAEPRADRTFELLEARRAIEPRVAQLAALRGTEDDFAAMRSSIELQAANFQDRRKALQAELLFHRKLWSAAGNAALEEMLRGLFDDLATVYDMALRTDSDRERAVDIHERTLAALMRGDPEAIDTAMDEHMSYLEQMAEEAFGRRRIREIPSFLRGSSESTSGTVA